MRYIKNKNTFIILLLLTLLIGYVSAFGFQHLGGEFKGAENMRFGIDIKGGIDAVFQPPNDLGRAPTETELDAARAVIESRLDSLNVLDREVTVDKINGYVFVRFPWKSNETEFDPGKAIEELGSMAHLTFRDPDDTVVLEGSMVSKATPMVDRNKLQSPYLVQLDLKPEGRQAFADATARLVNQRISIYMDDEQISSPTVQQAIDSDTCVITNLESFDYAKTLASQINSGSLPFALHAETFNAISPKLGSNALETMLLAGLVAFLLICLAMILYYRASGLVAVITLLLQLAGQILLLNAFQITVTLPGIAGIILAIGMGVAANIIISERVRDELKVGKNVDSALLSGFQRAFSSVLDSNLTVAIVSIIMMIFGSGSMLSFAFTLLFGIIMNFVAGIGANRVMLLALSQFTPFQKPSMYISENRMSKPRRTFDFYKNKKICYFISAAIIITGLSVALITGINLDIQFTGGAVLRYDISTDAGLNSDQAAGIAGGILANRNVSAQITTDLATNNKTLIFNVSGAVSNEEMQVVREALVERYPDHAVTDAGNNSVDPFFGRQFLRRGIMALVLSALFIILFVWFRYRKIHGLSAGAMALLALLHDVCIVFFAFVILGIPIGDAFVGVALMILGYSLSDTIVIYDRIRENQSKNQNAAPDELVNQSVSQNLVRSINTSVTVFVTMLIVYLFAIIFGLDSIRAFALPICIGTASGCYTSVCLTSPTWALWQNAKQKRLDRKKAAAK